MIYLDNAATTPLHPLVREAMEPYLAAVYGNPSSIHAAGRQAKKAIEHAREQIANAIGADPVEIVFTSGGTEADNAALIGTAIANQAQGKHIVTTAIEHHAVLHTCEFLEKMGYQVTYVAPDSNGIVSAESVISALRDDTILVSVMYVNNETGAILPIAEIAHACSERDILFHTDAVQAVGLLPIHVKQMKVDFLSISGHKLHGPKGIGALYTNRSAKWTPILHGGSQERKKRAGTENVPGIVGLGAALEWTLNQRATHYKQIQELRDRMLEILQTEVPTLQLLSPPHGLPSILSVAFPAVSTESLLLNLDLQGIAASGGSACTAGSLQPSHVLMAMQLPLETVKSAIRFSFAADNTLEEVELAANKTTSIVNRIRK